MSGDFDLDDDDVDCDGLDDGDRHGDVDTYFLKAEVLEVQTQQILFGFSANF